MTSNTNSPLAPVKSVNGQDYRFAASYLRNRDPYTPATSPDIKPKEQQGYYPISSLWTNTVNQNVWLLAGITNNLAKWVLISNGGTPALFEIHTPDGNTIPPDVNGLINFTSTGNTVTITGTNGGLGNQDINFDVNGGAIVEKFTVQAGSPTTIVPTAGNINVNGAIVAQDGHPVQSAGTSSNTYQIQVQQATTVSPTPGNNAAVGLASYNTNQFTVDTTSGMVSLKGGTTNPAVVGVTLQSGTSPIVPNASGLITLNGGVVAAGSTPIQSHGAGANTAVIQVQTSQAIASTNAANIGLAAFNSAQFTVDANGFVSAIMSPTNQEGIYNIGISYSSGVFTVLGANGSALSASNPGFVTIQNPSTPGLLTTISVTANQTFQDVVGTNTLSGNLFGMVSGDNFSSNDIPFYLYAVVNSAGTAISFMISRTSGMTIAPLAANIGVSGTPGANVQFEFFALNTPVVAGYASQPALLAGSFRMRKNTSGNFTVQTLNFQYDGIGNYQTNNVFSIPVATFGAAASSYWYSSGGTAPQWTTQTYYYLMNPQGFCTIYYNAVTVSVDGSGSTQTSLASPFASSGLSMGGSALTGEGQLPGGGANKWMNHGLILSSGTQAQFIFFDAGTSGNLTNGTMTAANVTSFYTAGTFQLKMS